MAAEQFILPQPTAGQIDPALARIIISCSSTTGKNLKISVVVEKSMSNNVDKSIFLKFNNRNFGGELQGVGVNLTPHWAELKYYQLGADFS